MGLERYPRNPNYGDGTLQRHIRVRSAPGVVIGKLDDNHHAMQCRLHHDGKVVTGIDSEMVRVPMSTCPGAKLILQELVDEPLARSWKDLTADGRARRQCTHLFDLALLAFGFASETSRDRCIDIVMPDAIDGLRTVRVWVDEVLVINWVTRDDVILSPEPWRGQQILESFLRRALETTSGIERDAALMAQKTMIVARGRSHIFDKREGAPISDVGSMLGVCYSYGEAHYSQARQIADHVIDLSDGVVESPDMFEAEKKNPLKGWADEEYADV